MHDHPNFRPQPHYMVMVKRFLYDFDATNSSISIFRDQNKFRTDVKSGINSGKNKKMDDVGATVVLCGGEGKERRLDVYHVEDLRERECEETNFVVRRRWFIRDRCWLQARNLGRSK